jgi:hypothetical protein
MATVTYDKDVTALLVIDPYNDFISEGGKKADCRHVQDGGRRHQLRLVYSQYLCRATSPSLARNQLGAGTTSRPAGEWHQLSNPESLPTPKLNPEGRSDHAWRAVAA